MQLANTTLGARNSRAVYREAESRDDACPCAYLNGTNRPVLDGGGMEMAAHVNAAISTDANG